MTTVGLECTACGVAVRLAAQPGDQPTVLWELDADGRVLRRGTVGEGHTVVGRGQPRSGSQMRYCPGPILPRVATAGRREHLSIDLTAVEDLHGLSLTTPRPA